MILSYLKKRENIQKIYYNILYFIYKIMYRETLYIYNIYIIYKEKTNTHTIKLTQSCV